MSAVVSETARVIIQAETWHTLDRTLERIGRDWAMVYRGPEDRPCLACGRPTRLVVSFCPRASLPICGTCRGY